MSIAREMYEMDGGLGLSQKMVFGVLEALHGSHNSQYCNVGEEDAMPHRETRTDPRYFRRWIFLQVNSPFDGVRHYPHTLSEYLMEIVLDCEKFCTYYKLQIPKLKTRRPPWRPVERTKHIMSDYHTEV